VTPHVYTVPAHVGFVDALAQGLLERTTGDRLGLARAQVWLPNRRAVRALTDAFVRCAGGGLLLPRMLPLAAVDDDAVAAGGDVGEDLEIAADIPPTLDPIERRLRLTQLVRQTRPAGITAIEALRLADQLAAAFDAIAFEEVDRSALVAAVPDGLAVHWDKTLQIFRVLLDHWPAELAALGAVDPAARQQLQLARLADRWATGAVPTGLIVAAGMTGAAPPVARLLARVARLPQGMVVLPGLDTAMPAEEWAGIRCHLTDDDVEHAGADSENHPQYTLKCLLHRLGVARGEVADWPVSGIADGPAARTAAVARAMRPADFTGRTPPADPALFDGVRSVVAADPAEEAQVVALALRRALEIPGHTAALVTPDRGLARRVAAHCARWNIDVDDSAGTPLRNTPPGALLLALVEAAARGFTPVALLAVVKHPLVDGGTTRLDWLDDARRLDRALRGVRPAPGLAGIAARIAAEDPALLPWWQRLADALAPLAAGFDGRLTDLAGLTATLREAAQWLCGDALWTGPAGRALAAMVERMERHGGVLAPFSPADTPALIAAFLGETAVRETYGKHPRLAIYGLLEARLQRADVMILAGLNEGSWPPLATPDPWLAPAIRARLRLPSLDRRTGLAAHDFVAAMGAPQVLLTRARRNDTAPQVPSRLWLRLEALAGAAIAPDDALLAQARGLDRSERVEPARRPRPAPPALLRPRKLSVTAAERLKADPFSFYAQTMLKLRPLEPLDQDPTAAERGSAVHAVLERWIKSGDRDPAALAALTEGELARWAGHPLMRALWAPRVRRMMDWVAETLGSWEADGWQPIAAEVRATLTLPNGITLTGTADRIDRRGGDYAIIDYKTGGVPRHAQMSGGYAPQLGLLGWLATGGRFADLPPRPVAALRYWKLGGGKDPGTVHDPLSHHRKLTPAADHIAMIAAQFIALCDERLLGTAPFTAKLHPEYSEKYSDYDQLARVLEWRGRPEA